MVTHRALRHGCILFFSPINCWTSVPSARPTELHFQNHVQLANPYPLKPIPIAHFPRTPLWSPAVEWQAGGDLEIALMQRPPVSLGCIQASLINNFQSDQKSHLILNCPSHVAPYLPLYPSSLNPAILLLSVPFVVISLLLFHASYSFHDYGCTEKIQATEWIQEFR